MSEEIDLEVRREEEGSECELPGEQGPCNEKQADGTFLHF